ncbi:MAG: sensor signal transduction histidine kinase [Polaromonas sp.]|nr:sensor signal transduction histidine kinase [Polaromonas sp.]
MTITYNFSLVLTSIMVAVLASYTALHLASRVSVSRGKLASMAWLVGGALSMGTGIWSMHFVGMLGSSIGIPMAYGPWWTLLSLMIAVTISGFALFFVRKEKLNHLSLAIGGVVMGGGIASMHYAGMMAMQISPAIGFDPVLVAVSILIAVLASFVALKLFVLLRSSAITHPLVKRGASALVMGVAIAGMHYTGMAAARFAPGSICTTPGEDVNNAWLASAIAVFTLLILAIALITSLYDAHLTSRAGLHNEHLVQANEKLRLESLQLEQANGQIRQQSDHLVAMNTQLEASVFKRTEQLQETVRELEAFSQAVAHDLRGPISSIGGFCGLLGKPAAGTLSDKGLHYVARIRDNSKKMADLIEALRSLTHLSQIALKHEQVDLSRLAQEAFEDCRMQHPGRMVHSSVQAAMQCVGDERLLRLVLVNLIGNAWKFSSRQADATVEVGMKPGPNGQAIFFVRDNGAGFDMAYADKLFGSFQRLHSPSEFEGTGIGLATVRRIILRHEGRIWAEAALEEGASFYFTLWEAAGGAQAGQKGVELKLTS